MSHKRNNPSEIVILFSSRGKLKRAREDYYLHTRFYFALSPVYIFFRCIIVWAHARLRQRCHHLDTYIAHIFYRI